MSGYKRATITITRDEYDRLHDAEQRLRDVPDLRDEVRSVIRQQSTQALQENLHEIEQRQSRFMHMLTGLQDSIRRQQENSTQALLEVQQEAVREAERASGRLWDHTNSIIQAQSQRFQQMLAESNQKHLQEMAQLSARMERLSQQDQRKSQFAMDWLQAAQSMAAFIHQNYSHDFFTPGKLSQIIRPLEQAQQNLENGLPEAAVLPAQQVYCALTDLRAEQEELHSQWQMLVVTNWETAQQILSQVIASQQVQAVDLDGNPLSYQVDVDYWSSGRYRSLVFELNQLLNSLESPEIQLDLQELTEMREQLLPSLYQSLEEIVLDARIQALNSQLRINIAELVVRALHDQGFSLELSDYEQQDERLAFSARLVNLEGNEVVVEVAPVGDDLGENELHLESLDREMRTEHELLQRWNEIRRSLSGYGLEIGATVQEEKNRYSVAHPDPSLERQRLRTIRRTATRPGS